MMVVVTRKKLRHYWPVYGLIGIPLGLVLLFNYYPIYNGFVHIFYRWDGDTLEEWIGLGNIVKMFDSADLGRSFIVVMIFILANIVKMIPAIVTAVLIHHVRSNRMQYAYRVAFVIPMIVPGLVFILMWKYFYEPNVGILNVFLRAVGVLGPIARIQWLSDANLIIPSLIFQGFPWVGAFGVLIYLAGLQNISESLYESASLDGAGALKTFWHIELPLIMTQVRINLVLMMIGTISGWEFVYLFLGQDGGTDGVAMVPGLIIFRDSFTKMLFGYGCAIGFLLFVITLTVTWLNSRFVRVEK